MRQSKVAMPLPLLGGVDQLHAEVACIADASLWHCWAVAAHINANLRNISRSLGSLASSAMRMLSCANKSKSSAVSTVGKPRMMRRVHKYRFS
jgi:hypothetical protein